MNLTTPGLIYHKFHHGIKTDKFVLTLRKFSYYPRLVLGGCVFVCSLSSYGLSQINEIALTVSVRCLAKFILFLSNSTCQSQFEKNVARWVDSLLTIPSTRSAPPLYPSPFPALHENANVSKSMHNYAEMVSEINFYLNSKCARPFKTKIASNWI